MRAKFTLLWLVLLPALALANTIGSGTVEFDGTLTDAGGGVYTGNIAATVGSWYVPGGGGEGVSTSGGFDVYAEDGGCSLVQGYYGDGAWNCSGTDTYTIGYLSSAPHDGYPDDGGGSPPWGNYWNPDCADYYNYEIELTADHWYLYYNGGTLGNQIATPMSGIMDWDNMYASENDVGTYVSPYPGGYPYSNTGDAAAFGAGAGWWDIDWSWGTDAIPLELAGFDVQIDDNGDGTYHVTLTPADPEEVWVDDDYTSATPGWGVTHFATIQEGIDAVDGSTVNVAAGTYYQELVVNKSVEVIGAGKATYDGSGNWTGGTLITRDPNVGGQATNQIVHITGANASMSLLTVDGRYGFDQGTGQTCNYGIMVAADGFELEDVDLLDITNNGIELNNADNGTLTNILCKRTAFAPGYYADFDYGLRCVDSENLAVEGLTAENVRRGMVVFQGYNSGTVEDLVVIGNNGDTGYGIGFYTSTQPGWWNPAWGDYEGDLTFTLAGDHEYSGVDYGIYISDELLTKDITLTVDALATFDLYGASEHGGYREGSGSVPDIDNIMADMGLTQKTVGPPDFYDYSPTIVWVDDDYYDGGSNDGHTWGYDAFDNIQEGIDAVDGSTVNVAAGTYVEALLIDKPLTLNGATSDDCKKDFTLPATLGDYDDSVQSIIKATGTSEPNAVTITSSDVVLKGFVIESLDRSTTGGNNNNNLIELRPSGTAATMTGIVIENNVIGPNTDTATQSFGRHGLRFSAGYGHTIGADVTCNKIHGTYGNGNNVFIWGTAYGTTGIPPAGPGPADLSGTTIDDNDICNSARSGVELSGAQFGATINNNTIHDNGAGHEGEDVDLKYGEGIAFVRDYIDVHWNEALTLGEDAGYVDGVTVTNNEIYDNDKNGIYMGPMNKNHVIEENCIYDNGNSARAPIPSSTFGPGDGIRIDLHGDYYLTWDWGALYGSTSNIAANDNAIYGNVGYGAQVKGTPTNGFVLDAENNWWGDATGPYHPTTNPAGLGNEVTDYIDYNPWTEGAYTVSQTASVTHIAVEEDGNQTPEHDPIQNRTTLTYSLSDVACADDYFAYDVHIGYPDANLTPLSVTQIYTPGVSHIFTHTPLGFADGHLTVSLALTGGDTEVDYTGNLFSVVFDGEAENLTALVVIDSLRVRERSNTPITPTASGDDITIQVDDSVPTLVVTNPGTTCVNSEQTFTFDGDDNVDLYRIQYQFDSDGWNDAVAANINGATYDDDWTTTTLTSLSEGSHTIYFRTWDDVGYVSSESSWTFLLDTLAPTQVTDLDATPEHAEINLTWTVATQHDGYYLYRAKRVTYPYFGGLTGESSWDAAYDLIATITDETQTSYQDIDFTDASDDHRAVYDYKLVTYDCVNSDAVSNTASATNYFLGDIAANDGIIFSGDLAILSGYYGTTTVAGTSDELDFGPTSDYSSYGLPLPDGLIDFEDLIIFAMNYAVAGPTIPITSFEEQRDKATPATDQEMIVSLEDAEDGYQLALTGELKGFSARLQTERQLESATAAGYTVMTYRDADSWVIDVIALEGLIVDGTAITLDFNGEGDLMLTSVDGRDGWNQPVLLTFQNNLAENLPDEFRLAQNYPNPFNPVTTIDYDLVGTVQVQLLVYNSLGQQVATVVNETQPAGRYSVSFDGSQLASGIYFYQIQAGEFVELKKMMIVK